MFTLGSKAETLEKLSDLITTAKVLPQIRITLDEYMNDQDAAVKKVEQIGWLETPLIVRSSSQAEDHTKQSLAGHFTSVLNVQGKARIQDAIERVIHSFQGSNKKDQLFLQPMLQDVSLSGVAFSKNPTSGAPYILINYDDSSGSTSSVTSGDTNDLKAYCHYRHSNQNPPPPLDRIVALLFELEHLFHLDQLDIEFAITQSGDLYLLQARPLIIAQTALVPTEAIDQALSAIHQKIKTSYGPHPYLFGSRAIYGIMPDWNPAEIIGVKPRPLAFSLYKEMVTDQIWAYQRDNYGYRNLRSFPLLINFHGLPYIDVRVSFNSFIPRSLDKKLADKLVNYYLDRLESAPHLHDKVEFEIIYSCYTLDLPIRLEILKNYGFTSEEIDSLTIHLRNLTNTVINGENGLWRTDIEKISKLDERYEIITQSSLDLVSKIYWLLEDCKRYGTLPFAGLARAGFIAVQLLKSLIAAGIISTEEYHYFLHSLDTVSSQMAKDFTEVEPDHFLQKYGHLRPGTYDILSARYDEMPDQYFKWGTTYQKTPEKKDLFQLSLKQIKQIEELLKKHGITHNIISFFDFIKAAIEGREYSKFIFSRNLSYALNLFKELGGKHDLSAEECSFANICCIKELYGSSLEADPILQKSIQEGKQSFSLTEQIILPSLLHTPDQIFSFHIPNTEPNYVTLKKVQGHISKVSDDKSLLKNSILLIPSADPGFDWIFSHQIAGFITMYGGMNSHMAIRASELNIPAVIGAGETLYCKWEKAKILEMDCTNRLVRVLQ